MPAARPPFVVETGKRLSESLLWELQRRYFAGTGIEAWRANVVPQYITTNPFTAQAYARVALGFLRDCAPAPDAPLTILELGAGSGRFAFHFLNKFLPLLDASPLRGTPVRYVLSDFSAKTVEFWRAHPAFQEHARAGRVDFACFDALAGESVDLLVSGERLAPGSLRGPLLVIANYFFDSIPQDAFSFDGGSISECLVTLTSPQAEPDPSDPAALARLSITFHNSPAAPDYYADPDLDAVLAYYRQKLEKTYLLFPAWGIRRARWLHSLLNPAGSGKFLLLAGDTGHTSLAQIDHRGAPDVRMHGSFSMNVNFHAVGRWARGRGGAALVPPQRHSQLAVCAFPIGQPGDSFTETRLAYAEAVERGGPDDFFMVKRAFEKHYGDATLDELLGYLRLSGWDERLFLDMFAALIEKAPAASERWQEELFRSLEKIAENEYAIGEERDVAFQIGVLLYRLGRSQRALAFFTRSLERSGPSPSTHYNAAMCLAQLRQPLAAREHIRAALALDPKFEPALSLQAQLDRSRSPIRKK